MTGLSSSDLAELSRLLYSPVTLALYVSASLVSFYGLTATVGGGDVARGRIAKRAGWILAWLGVAAHTAHEVVRGLAQSRLPLGNMFEVTSLMALVGVAGGLVYLRRRGRDELTGFVMLGGTLVLGLALLMYAEPGPLMPILDTWWRTFHVSLLVGAMGVFAAGFVFTGLHLLRDTGVPQGSTVGAGVAAGVGAGASGASGAPVAAIEESDSSVALLGHVDDAVRVGGGSGDTPADPAWRAEVRGRISVVRLAVGTFVGTSLVSWVWAVSVEPTSDGVRRMLTVNVVMVAAALLAWWLTPYLPDAAVLDGIAHRIIAFAFVLWTVGTIAGAMWAEQSWGRFWGWDPKETGAFLTWVAYAGYLHARATRGVRGRRAAWIGIGAFITLMATYLVANYVIVGLHSYAGL
jgi:ABC-type transport system involved in cytochrome c biogenesis permease subunit